MASPAAPHFSDALVVLDFFGIAVFAISGALLAAEKRQTLVTFIFFAVITGVGGGTLRDLLIGAPVFWVHTNATLLICIGAADSITALPHQGYIVRTQPHTSLQGQQFANFAIAEGAKHLYILMPQTPFTESTIKVIVDTCATKNINSRIECSGQPSARRFSAHHHRCSWSFRH